MYSDIFGLLLPNNKLIADSYAKSGEYLVYMPDFFKGDAMTLDLADILIPVNEKKQSKLGKYTGLLTKVPSFLMWSARHKEGPTNKVCMDWLGALRRATPQGQKIGIVGFCWGGKYAIRAGKESNMTEVNGKRTPLVDAVVGLHPSHLAVSSDVEDLIVPVSYGWGKEDSVVPFKQHQDVVDLHAKLAKEGKKMPEMEHKVYTPGRHGFAVRGNPDDPQERACLEDSIMQVLNWFSKWL
jgi:dienelactone hydrolase